MTTDKTIEEMNIEIAKFLGFTYYDHGIRPCVVDHLKNAIHVTDLKYHEDWNQLMRCVEKIERIFNSDYITITIWENKCTMKNENGSIHIKSSQDCSNKFTAIYDACYKFIQWFNTTTKQKD